MEGAMTFSEGMKIDTTRAVATGGGGRGLAIGGGIGGLIIVLLALFLGVDPGGVINQQQLNTEDVSAPGFDLSQCKTGADANKYVDCRVVATGNSVDGVWSQLLQGYTAPHMRLFKGQVDTGCGPATSDVGPFYCPVDQTAYFDTDFFQVLVDQFGSSGGPFAQEYVVAHEYGHHVQDQLGLLGGGSGGTGAQSRSVRTELQADCLAGVWANHAAQTGYLTDITQDDIADGLNAAAAVGDDRIQQQTQGRIDPESWTHGASSQRQHWFTVGSQQGNPNACDTSGKL
jgi:uncharacterized protein